MFCEQKGKTMPTMTLDMPTEVFSSLRRTPGEFVSEMRLIAAAHWYHRGDISQEKAALIAGINRADFINALAKRGMDVFVVDLVDLQEELDRG